MMICFPARGDDSEEQRKRLQQQQSGVLFRPLGTLHSPSSYQIVAGVITAEVPPCSLVRNTAPVHQHGRSGHVVCSTLLYLSIYLYYDGYYDTMTMDTMTDTMTELEQRRRSREQRV